MKHDEAQELLPELVNATLPPDRRQALEEHLEGCETCRRALGVERRLRAAVSPMPAPAPGLLARTLARIDAGEVAAAPPEPTGGRRGIGRLKRAWIGWWQPLPTAARVLIAAQLVLIAVLGGALLQGSEPAGQLRTLGGAGGVEPDGGGGRLRVLFAEEAPEREIRQLLRSRGASIVAGPSAAGYYTIEVPVAAGSADAVADELAARPDLVRFAAPVAPGEP